MNVSYREQVANAIEATRIHSPACYSWFGRKSQPLTHDLKEMLSPEATRACMLVGLQHQLYKDFYSSGLATPVSNETATSPSAIIVEHTQRLSVANAGIGYWDSDWQIEERHTGFVEVSKRGLRLKAGLEDLECGSIDYATGEICRLRFPREELGTSPGFYTAIGDDPPMEPSASDVFRLYWNITAEGSIALMRKITGLLNRDGISFRFKTLKDPTQYTRCDSAVLYFRAADTEHVARLAADSIETLGRELKYHVPAFTLQVAAGIGLAEDPKLPESFGLHRCRLLADGILEAHARGAKSLKERLQIVEARFLQDGISLDQPFLNPGSRDPGFSIIHRRKNPHQSPSRNEKGLSQKQLLVAARRIGDTLCDEAWWHEGRCNWLGPLPNPDVEDQLSTTTNCRALGCELYGGTSGIALFLAELHVAAPDARVRDTALSAIRQALARKDSVPSEAIFGLYSGWTGIAVVAARIGQLLHDEECLAGAANLANDLVKQVRAKHRGEFDLLSGIAGAVLGLVILQCEFRSQQLLDSAVVLGDQLLRLADKSERGYSWKSVNFPARQSLTGFSHGTAGVGTALLELANATGDLRYHKAAIRSFEYERYWFDTVAQNWPDFRELSGLRRAKKHQVFATAWCHGAPGIALSRLRAWELFRDEVCRDEATIALETTRRMIKSALESRDTSLSLCHGLCGNADVLLEAEGIAKASHPLLGKVARYSQAQHDTPGLMTGRSGQGYFYLRLRNRSIPSVLLPRPGWVGAPHLSS